MNAVTHHIQKSVRLCIQALLAAVLFIGALAGCSSFGEVAESTPTPTSSISTVEPNLILTPVLLATPASPARSKVSIWTSWDPVELRALRSIIEQFVVEHPEFEFSISYYPPDQLLEAFMGCTSRAECPTLLVGPSRWGPLLVEESLVIDVSSLIDPQLQRDLFPIAWDQVILGNVMTGLPLELQGLVLYRNTTLVPRQASNVADLIVQALSLRESTQLASYFDFGFYESIPFLAACGGDLLNAAGEPAILGEPGICWLELLRNLASSGRVVISSDDDLQAFVADQSGWLIESSLQKPSLLAALGQGTLTVDPWPLYGETGMPLKGFVWSENVYISARLDQDELDAGWTFTRFLFSAEAQAILSEVSGAGHIPVQGSITLADPLMQAISEMLRSGVPLPLRTDLERFTAAIEGAINDVVLQGADPEQALIVASDRINGLAGTPQAQP